jgi:hypothetical protein
MCKPRLRDTREAKDIVKKTTATHTDEPGITVIVWSGDGRGVFHRDMLDMTFSYERRSSILAATLLRVLRE